ncbi:MULTISPECIES: hypothetical protein [unclassified Cryobacterium]|uniref:hypothetical protein n=1 Tax=unclassified Cryobacterium TaxID=2649013 RepID=UPI00106C7CC8|nr:MULTISPECIES: hypothetical protein [unclassified Cryobacterium]TFD07472.1 hypothetical protein E3T29_06130 [Cryobacterium sp. TMT1-66-1]TFD14367.1 hypothetical protein E3T35_02950 [Cryobacterium sp. TMT1-2-2]
MKIQASARSIGGLAAAATVVLALVGCSAFFPADVTPTASVSSPEPVACSQKNAQLTWHPLQDAEPAALGHRELTVAADGTESTVDTALTYTSSLVSDDLLSRDYFEPDWIDFLLAEFERTGQTDITDLGHPRVDFEGAKPSVPLEGTTIIGFATDQIQVGFDLSCAGVDVGSGLLTTSGNGLNATMLVCGQPAPAPTMGEVQDFLPQTLYQKQLRSYCPNHG